MSQLSLRWGLLSTAHINSSLIPPLRQSSRNELIAVASRSLEKAQQYNKDWNIPRIFGSYEEMLEDPEIDVVYISLPNSFHAEWCIKAAQAGKHILCEKPLAINVQDVDRIALASKEAGVVITEAIMYRHHLQTLKVKELIDVGAIGQLTLVRGAFSAIPSKGQEGIRFDKSLGGGSLWDLGCYAVSFARFVVGAEPEEVFGWQVTGTTGVDLTFVGQMRFANGVFAQFDSSFHTSHSSMEFVGNEGKISIPRAFKRFPSENLIVTRNEKEEHISVDVSQHRYAGEIEDICDAILLNKSPRVSLKESRGNVVVLNALYRSAQEGLSVTI